MAILVWMRPELETQRQTLLQHGATASALRERAPIRRLIGQVSAGPDTGQVVSLGARSILVGADPEADLALSDPTVSRRHAELQLTPQGVAVRDLDSTNGTFWQSSRVGTVVVPVDATLQFGDTTLRLRPETAPLITPSARVRMGGLVGTSVAMREVFALLELAGPTDATVLIEGESGTGKELAARALHDHSQRADQPFVVVDCGALTESLIDSALFGHVRGAFTGAAGDRKGAFLAAKGGTVFLDEIGELPRAAQTKLLRVIEAQTVTPVGSDQLVSTNTRVVAATHRDLSLMVAAESFRFDLYHRLAVVHLRMPPLRERLEDLPCLVEAFYEGRGLSPGEISGPRLQQLRGHSWPGNVRELRNVLERAWVLAGTGGASFAELPFFLTPSAQSSTVESIDLSRPFKAAKEEVVARFERRYLAAVFAQCNQNISRAAEQAGINRRHFRELLVKHHLIEP